MIKRKIVETLYGLADYFMVTEEFARQKLEFMAKQEMFWKLDEARSLCLTGLPSVFIHENC
ncbi:hypothetical protein [Geosporobacter ferrireducens]|uniref:hypothetical protein n=1 Tax=Geosporobacter ferrireducens TaxID=1424294 RepID=UPI001F1AEEE7|nr:hypothetical protein [Geosporobacter ferrireducens]